MLLSELPSWFVHVTAISLGLCFGSFLNVVIFRLPRGQSLSHPPSTCPSCGKPIAAYDNVPVLAWLWLRGKARCCGTRISSRYPLIEALGGLLAWALVTARLAPFAEDLTVTRAAVLFVSYLGLGLCLIALSFIDLEYMLLPDSLTLGGAAAGLAFAFFRHDGSPFVFATAALLGYGVVWLPFIWLHEKLRGFPGMGLGDAKLMLLAGAWFGYFGVFFVLFAGAVQGSVTALVVLLVQGKVNEPPGVTAEREELRLAIEAAEGEERAELEQILAADPVLSSEPGAGLSQARIAFGPFLALACLELLIFGEPIQGLFQAWFDGAL